MSFNKAIIIGRLGRDPEVRFTQTGKQVANFSMATDESFKNNAGEKVKQTEWHRIVVWGKLSEIVQKYVHKGDLICIEGRLKTRKWDKDGVTMYSTEIVAENMRMLGGKRDGQGGGSPAHDDNDAPAGHYGGDTTNAGADIYDEDIPF